MAEPADKSATEQMPKTPPGPLAASDPRVQPAIPSPASEQKAHPEAMSPQNYQILEKYALFPGGGAVQRFTRWGKRWEVIDGSEVNGHVYCTDLEDAEPKNVRFTKAPTADEMLPSDQGPAAGEVKP